MPSTPASRNSCYSNQPPPGSYTPRFRKNMDANGVHTAVCEFSDGTTAQLGLWQCEWGVLVCVGACSCEGPCLHMHMRVFLPPLARADAHRGAASLALTQARASLCSRHRVPRVRDGALQRTGPQ